MFNLDKCMYKDICGDINTDNCNNVCQRYIITNFLLERSGIPENRRIRQILQTPRVDEHSYTLLNGFRKDIAQFVRNGNNLYIVSHNRYNGKTSWAISLMLKYFDEVWYGNGFVPRGLFISVPIFLTKLKNTISNPDIRFEQLKELIRSVDLIIWDDIATTQISTYDQSTLYAYISERMLTGKSNIYTGVLNSTELEWALGSNLANTIKSNLYPVRLQSEGWGKEDDFITNIE